MLKRISLIFCMLAFLCPECSFAKVHFPYKGEVNFRDKELYFELSPPEGNPLFLRIKKDNESYYRITFNLHHLKTPFFDISTILEIFLEFVRDENQGTLYLKGEIFSKYSLIDYKPIQREVSGVFELKENYIIIKSLYFQDGFCKGSVQIVEPYTTALSLQLSAMDINDFLMFFVDKEKVSAEGNVDGEIRISGEMGKIKLEGALSSFDGFVNKLEYRTFMLNAQGVYPNIDISGTNITQTDGMIFNVIGRLDLSDKENYEKQIKSLVMEPLVTTDGQSLEWTLKRLKTKEESGMTELKYLRRKEKDLNRFRNEESEMLGVERKMEF